MTLPNFDVNFEFIEARTLAGENQSDLELFAAYPEGANAGGQSSSSASSASSSAAGGGLAVNPVIIEHSYCSALDQYVLARSGAATLKPVLVGSLTLDDYLYDPLAEIFRKIIALEEVVQPTLRIKTESGAETVVSRSHPVIRSFADFSGRRAEDLQFGDAALTIVFFESCGQSPVISIEPAGARPTLKISLDSADGKGGIYACGKYADAYILGHNAKPHAGGGFGFEVQVS
jgi:hypothetical protein